MKNTKRVMSLLLVVVMMVLAVTPVMAATTKNIAVYATIKDANGRVLSSSTTYTDIKAGDKITVTASCPDTDSISWSKDASFMNAAGYKVNDKGMAILAYVWDNETKAQAKISNDPTKMTITVPAFAEGTTHTLKVEAVGAIDGLVDNGVSYVANTNWITIKFTIPKNSTTPSTTTTASTSLKYKGRELSTSKVEVVEELSNLVLRAVTNGTVDVLGYKWDDLPSRGGENSTYTIPVVSDFMPGETHTLQVQMITADGVKSEKQTYTIKIAEKAAEEDDEEEYDDNDGELIVEPWMREEDGLTKLAVSLRNDSEDEDKANKNIFALNEEVIYYVDYKNGGRATTKDVTLVLNIPETFKVVKSDGGSVSTKKGTITWTFDGLDKEEAGTKVVVLKYTNIGTKKITSKTIKPLAEIKLDGKVKDSSGVINLIYKDGETELKDEHFPYMFGDKDATTFRPNDGITRGEAALVLTRTLGISTAYDRNTYDYFDLDETYLEARKAIVAATAYGIVQGYGDGTYRPNELITRAEFMTILANLIEADNDDGFEIKDSSSSIKRYKDTTRIYALRDAFEDEHWAIDEVTLLARLNMTPLSESSRNIRLDDAITRAEVAQFMNYFLLRAPAEVTSKTKSGFSDVNKNHKLFADIIEATRAPHTYYITEETTEAID